MVSLKQALAKKLTKKELPLVPKSFDIIGSKEKSVALIEIKNELKSKDKIIGETILKLYKPVKSVLKKVSERKGTFRLKKYKLITGDKNTEVVHKEYGCLFKLDPKKVYFSPRESTERIRIASLAKPNEKILVMFSGVSPFSIVLAKKQPKISEIYSIEINPSAHKYAIENIRLNKVENKVIPLLGDVKKYSSKFKNRFDRVVMPLPKGAYEFLNLAIKMLKERGYIHFYYWSREPNLFKEGEKLIKKIAKENNIKVRMVNKKKVLPYGPKTYKIVFDLYFRK
jgi:tRNA (guanine37-N1)-methyltransferase